MDWSDGSSSPRVKSVQVTSPTLSPVAHYLLDHGIPDLILPVERGMNGYIHSSREYAKSH